MASTQAYQKIILTSDDVPGAKLNIEELENYLNTQLKRWLECRGLKTTGNRSDLLQRCRDAVNAGKLEDIDVNVDGGKWFSIKENKQIAGKKEQFNPAIPPVLGWKPFPSRSIPSNFNYGHIYYYLLESVVLIGQDGKSEDTDLSHMTSKPLTKGEQYVKSGSVTNMMDTEKNNNYFVKASVAASMRNETRNVHVTISSISGAIKDASCTCPGSALGRCNHVAAVLLMIDKHCKEYGHTPQACTSKPCEWNKGKRSKNPGKVSEASYSSYREKQVKLSEFDPRPSNLRPAATKNLNSFLSSLKYGSTNRASTSMWESLLSHDYMDYEVSGERRSILNVQVSKYFSNLKEECEKYESDQFMIPGTELQSESAYWKASRWFRITASTAKQANNLGALLLTDSSAATLQKLHTFIRNFVWNLEPFSSADMAFGIENEDKARDDYLKYLNLTTTASIHVEKTGFWVNSMWPELGCSPDGLVIDPTEPQKHGLVEIKCLKIFRTVTPSNLFHSIEQNIVKKSELYSACFGIPTNDGAPLQLKTNHSYYYQIQFQMAITGLSWCDFVLWSPIGEPSVQRIRRDEDLIVKIIGHVTLLWHRVIAPEIFEMRVPRNLKPIILN